MSLPASLAALVIEPPESPRRSFAGVDPAAVIYLRAESKEDMDAALAAAGIVANADGSWPSSWPGLGLIDVVGTIYNDDMVMGPDDEDGLPTVISGPTAKSGWHVNVLAAG